MPKVDTQIEYWNRIGSGREFSHPIDVDLLATHLTPAARTLDLGCGYGRVAAVLWSRGFKSVIGVDPSDRMIARGRAEHPHLDLRVQAPGDLPFADHHFDAVLLFAVLTCIPQDDRQRALAAGIHRVLRPGGLLYLSDYGIQADERNVSRYIRDHARFGTYGVFEVDGGVIVRHHTREWLQDLFPGYETLHHTEVQVLTMNGNPARAIQFLLRKP